MILKAASATAAATAVVIVPAKAEKPGQTVTSTSYCDNGTMADGSQTRFRSVAMNTLPLGTKIILTGPKSRTFYGLRRFVVRDHIGSGSQLDFWHRSCSASMTWGRRPVTFRLGWAR